MAVSIFTLPAKFNCLAIAGYSGTTLLLSFRFVSPAESCAVALGETIAEALSNNARPSPKAANPSRAFIAVSSPERKTPPEEMQR
jgi:hypothetical protein